MHDSMFGHRNLSEVPVNYKINVMAIMQRLTEKKDSKCVKKSKENTRKSAIYLFIYLFKSSLKYRVGTFSLQTALQWRPVGKYEIHRNIQMRNRIDEHNSKQ